MAPPCAVILNPRSQHGRVGRELPRLKSELASGIGGRYDITFHATTAPEEATAITRRCLREGAELIIAVGGDGTFHEVANGYYEDGVLVRDVPLALLSRGTGGDTRRTLGLPLRIPAFTDMLARGKLRRIDLGLVEFFSHDGRPLRHVFINIADLGVSGDVVNRVNQGSKRMGGFLSFLSSTLKALWQFEAKLVEVRCDDHPPERIPLVILAVANCRYFGGGMQVAPRADPSDGLFDVVTVAHHGRRRLFMNLPRIYAGTHLGLREVGFRRARTVVATPLEGDVLIDLDGEQPGKLPVTFTVIPGALQVFVP